MPTTADILSKHGNEKGALISILQEVQESTGYLPEEAISQIAAYFRISQSEVFGVASFYTQFYFSPRGKHTVKVCLGTACHVRGGQRIMNEAEKELGLKPGETTEDYAFSLERVACFGCCALAPVMVVDKTTYPEMTRTKVDKVIKSYKVEET